MNRSCLSVGIVLPFESFYPHLRGFCRSGKLASPHEHAFLRPSVGNLKKNEDFTNDAWDPWRAGG